MLDIYITIRGSIGGRKKTSGRNSVQTIEVCVFVTEALNKAAPCSTETNWSSHKFPYQLITFNIYIAAFSSPSLHSQHSKAAERVGEATTFHELKPNLNALQSINQFCVHGAFYAQASQRMSSAPWCEAFLFTAETHAKENNNKQNSLTSTFAYYGCTFSCEFVIFCLSKAMEISKASQGHRKENERSFHNVLPQSNYLLHALY